MCRNISSSCFFCAADFSDSYGSSDEDDHTSPMERVLTNRKGQTDFRIKSLKMANVGRKFIGIAEHGKRSKCMCMNF